MKRLGILGLAIVLAMPLATACYAPRIESCRDPMGDFSSFSGVAISHADTVRAFESASASVELAVTATTSLGSGERCVAVRSELRDSRGGLVEVLDTSIRAHVSGGVLTTTPILHYHSSSLAPMTVHVTALGATLDRAVADPRFTDAGPDAGPRDAAARD